MSGVVCWLCCYSPRKKIPAGDLFTDYGINVCDMVKNMSPKKDYLESFLWKMISAHTLALSSILLMDSTNHE